MARQTMLVVACVGLIWMSRSVGGALLEIDDYRPSVGLRAAHPSVQVAHGARAKLPARLGARPAQPLSAESMTVVATNEPVEYPGFYASLLRADAADMSADATFGASTWQGATSSAIHLQVPGKGPADFIRLPVQGVSRPKELVALAAETFDEYTCSFYPTCDFGYTCLSSYTCTSTCGTAPTCSSSTTCNGYPTCGSGATCSVTCMGQYTCSSTCLLQPTCDSYPTVCYATCFGPTCDSGYTCSGYVTCELSFTCASTCEGSGPTCGSQVTCDGGVTCASTCLSMPTCDLSQTCGSGNTCDGTYTCDSSSTCGDYTCFGVPTCNFEATCIGFSCEFTYCAEPTCDGGITCDSSCVGARQPTLRASRKQVFLAKVFDNLF